MTQITDGDLFWLLAICGSVLGIVLNSYLIASLISKWKKYPFACLFTATALFDLIFSLVEVSTQHQIAIKNGVLLVLPRGIEWLIKNNHFLIEVVFLLHCGVCMYSIFSLPALYNYHYIFVKNGCRTPKSLLLFRNLFITAFLAFVVGLSASMGIHESMQRGRDYYTRLFDDNWLKENEQYYMYSCDINDPGTIGYFAGGLTLTTLSIALTSYYAFKARSLTHFDDLEHQHDQRTKIPFTRTQFTRALMLRTINTWIFALLPISLVTIAIIFRFDIEILGDLVVSPWCLLSAANAATTLFVIRK